MHHLSDLVQYLQEYLQVDKFSDYCPNGMQVEGSSENITSIATAVSADLETIQKAAQLKAQVLITHHGLFWDKESQRICGSKKEKVELLLKHGITLLSYHLPLDAHQKVGNNFKAAIDLKWTKLTPFAPFPNPNSLPIGVIGHIPKVDVQHFKKSLEDYYQHQAHHAPGGPQTLSKVALISGGAHKAINLAIEAGADAFITGSFDEPLWHIAKEEKIHFFALGHSSTEKIGPRALGEHLAQQFNYKHHFLNSDNPF